MGAVIFWDRHSNSALGSRQGYSENTPHCPPDFNYADLLRFSEEQKKGRTDNKTDSLFSVEQNGAEKTV